MNVRIAIIVGLAVATMVVAWFGLDEPFKSPPVVVVHDSGSEPAPPILLPGPPAALTERIESAAPDDPHTDHRATGVRWSGAPTPEAMMSSLVAALATENAEFPRGICVTPYERVWGIGAELIDSADGMSHSSWRLSQAKNLARIREAGDWSTATVRGVALIPFGVAASDEFHAQVTLDGRTATLVLRHVVRRPRGWVTWDREPFELRFDGPTGEAVR